MFILADFVVCVLLLAAPQRLAPMVPPTAGKDLIAPAFLLHLVVGVGVAAACLLPDQARSLLTREHSSGRLVASGPTATYRYRPGPWIAAGLLLSAGAGLASSLAGWLETQVAPVVRVWATGRAAAYALVLLAAVRAVRIARHAEEAGLQPVDRLRRDFLDSEEDFRACQRFWRDLLDSVAARAGQSGEWVRWLPEAFADGSPFPREFRSMLEARSARLRRAVRILQAPPESDDVEIAAWFADYSDFESLPPTTELVIHLSMSEEAASHVERLLEAWLDPSASPESLGPLIEQLPKPAESQVRPLPDEAL